MSSNQPYPPPKPPAGWPPDCPPPPSTDDVAEVERTLGFTRQPSVRWFNVPQLARTGVKTVLSSLFGSYADKREVMQGRAAPVHDFSQHETVWLDYVADLGDGFDSTYTMASLVSRPTLAVDGHATERGRLMVLGGDQVYPTATREEYNDRLVGPFRAALPWTPPTAQAPCVMAVPGNHDWYDGLTSFTRLFLQKRWLGGWQTCQERSYFAIKLPYRWWLLGVDVQLESDIDEPQLQYFRDVAKKEMQEGDRVILCTAEPSWVHAGAGERGTQSNLDFLERDVIRKHGRAVVRVYVAGDLHHYARYESPGGAEQRITSGGGGAFYHECHNLPHRLELAETDPHPGAAATTRSYENPGDVTFPPRATSRRLMLKNVFFPWKNWDFAAFLGGFYLFLSWLLQSASRKDPTALVDPDENNPAASLVDAMRKIEPRDIGLAFEDFWRVLLHTPGSAILAALVVLGMVGLFEPRTFYEPGARRQPDWLRWPIGVVHGLVQLSIVVVAFWGFCRLNPWLAGWLRGLVGQDMGITDPDAVPHVVLFAAEMFVIGGTVGAVVFGLYLMAANLVLGAHNNMGSSALRERNYKNFVRMRVDRDGLTLYPIGVEKVNRRWKANAAAAPGDPMIVPETGTIADLACLIEGPIHVSHDSAAGEAAKAAARTAA